MNAAILAALWGHWRRNPIQLLTLLGGLALATALWSGVQAINAEARASYDAAANTLGQSQFDRLVRSDGMPIAQDTYITLRRAGWQVSPVIEGPYQGARLIGIEPLTAPQGLAPPSLQLDAQLQDFIAQGGQIIAAPDVAIAGVMIDNTLAAGTAMADIGTVQRLLGRDGEIDTLLVGAVQPLGRAPLDQIAPTLNRKAAQGGSDIARLTDSFHLNLTAFGLLSFAVGIFIVHGAIGLAFEQRRSTVRTLRALGAPLGRLIWIMGAELMALAAIAGAIGVGLGYLIAGLLLPDVAATLRGLYGANIAGTLELRPSWWVSGMAIAVVGTAIASSAALWKLSHMPLLASAQPRAMAMRANGRARLQGGVALALLTVAAVMTFWADGVVSGFVLLGALMIGAAMALPVILGWVLRLASAKSTAVVPQWFWADTRQQLPGLSLALMALLLAMAANVGVSTMVSSFRLTFVSFLDQRLSAELYVTTDSAQQAEDFVTYVAPKVDAILPIMEEQTLISGNQTVIMGVRDHATYRDNWAFLDAVTDPWDALHAGGAVLINEQLARRAKLTIGDPLDVAGESHVIAGIVGDYGNPLGQVIVSETLYQSLFPDDMPVRFGLRMPPDAVAVLATELEENFGFTSDNMINQSQIKAYSLAIFDRTFTVTAALNVLTLAVAGFAILMSLLTLTAMRVPQLAPAWAMGLTRRQLGRLELLRTLMLATMTGVLALPLGLVLAWVLLSIVNVAAFGWQLPMFLFPWDYVRLGVFAVLAAAAAAVLPAVRLARTPATDLLKVFSNER